MERKGADRAAAGVAGLADRPDRAVRRPMLAAEADADRFRPLVAGGPDQRDLRIDVVIIEAVDGGSRARSEGDVDAAEELAGDAPVIEDPRLDGDRPDGKEIEVERSDGIGQARAIPRLADIGTVAQPDQRPIVEAHLGAPKPQSRTAAGNRVRDIDERLRHVEPVDVERRRTRIATDLIVVAELDEHANIAVRLKVGEHEQPMQVVGLARA